MTQRGKISKERIIEMANRLFYTKGYNQTSFADVADGVGITKGNLHYHFNSKEDLLTAVIAYREDLIISGLAQWESEFPDAKARLKRFVQMLRNEADDITRFGCPIGSLNVELGKCQTELQTRTRELFDLYRNWLEQVFRQLGKKKYQSLSQHLLSMAQGAAVMSYVYADTTLLKNECRKIDDWIDAL